MDKLKQRMNNILIGRDGDCVVDIHDLHTLHNMLQEAYELGRVSAREDDKYMRSMLGCE